MDVIWRNLPYMLRGLELTVVLATVSLVGSFVLGTLLALLRMSAWRALRWSAAVYVDVVRMIPLVMVIFWVFFLIPKLSGQPVTPVVAALIALTGFNASYMAEVIRAGIQTVPNGLVEAARSSGLTYMQTMTRIVLPLAFKNMLPAIVNRFIALFMGTSVAYIIGVTEFFRAANDINNRVFRPYEIYSFVAVVYFLFCYCLSLLGRALERRLAVGQVPASARRITSD
jgi:His/Glu/Gln/Arg/opine family amino acid ABC transporter permease subunit